MKKFYHSATAFLLVSFSIIFPAHAQLVLQDSISFGSLVNDYFNSGTLVTISNITFNGVPADSINPQIGYFSNGLGDGLQLDNGLVMATSELSQAVFGDFSGSLGMENYQDSDIQTLSNVSSVNNCAVLEFDVLVDADMLAFNYIFASTEYEGFTCSSFNDAFGFFVSGPGVQGPYSSSALNIATIPGSDVPVSINTINQGFPSFPTNASLCESANPNWQADTLYYISNNSHENSSMMLNGYTINMEALVDVVNGETYHMKLAICNALDMALHSAVFLGAGSFEGRLASSTGNMLSNKKTILYPNPGSEILNIENACLDCQGNLIFVIRDAQGREISNFTRNSAELVQLPVNQLENGVYFISTWSGNEIIGTHKFVKR